MTKMTYVSAIDYMLNTAESTCGQDDPTFSEACEKLEALKATLINRKSGSKSPTKTQKENAVIMENMTTAMADIGTPCTVTELLKHGIEGYELSNQKASALLRNLIKDGKVTKTMEGKKALFSLV